MLFDHLLVYYYMCRICMNMLSVAKFDAELLLIHNMDSNTTVVFQGIDNNYLFEG